jgi:hypothetical protein
MNALEIIIIFIFGLWLAATLVYQIFTPQLMNYTSRWDIFRWLPAYHLFSGTPREFRLFYRDRALTGESGDWIEIPLYNLHKWYNMAWCSNDFVINIIASSVDDLVNIKEQPKQKTSKDISQRFVYQIILRYVSRVPKSFDAVERQFKVEEAGGYITTQSNRQIFFSDFHAL